MENARRIVAMLRDSTAELQEEGVAQYLDACVVAAERVAEREP
jgi:hypothetical protein